MKSHKSSERTGYPNKVGVNWVSNDGEVGWVLAFFDDGDLTMGFLDRKMDAIGQVPSPEEFKHQYPTDPAFFTVYVSAQAVEWIWGKIEHAMSRQRENKGPWSRSELEGIRDSLTLAIDEKRKLDRSFFGGNSWPRNSPAQGPEAIALRDKALRMAEELRALTQKYNNAAMMTFKKFHQVTAVGESDDFTAAPLQQAMETLITDGWSPVGTLAVEYLGENVNGETACIHIGPYTGSGMEPKVQVEVLRKASLELMNRLNEKPAPDWFRREKPAIGNQSEEGEVFLRQHPHFRD